MVIKHGRIIQREHARAQRPSPQHPETSDITLPEVSACSENQPEAFQKGKIGVVLSNAKLTYGTSTPEGKQQSRAHRQPEDDALCHTKPEPMSGTPMGFI